jgi:hypothetical protein
VALNRRGAALLVALQAIFLLAGLAGMALFAARLRWSSGQRALAGIQMEAAATGALDRALARWDPLLAESLSLGGAAELPPSMPWSRDSLIRLGRFLYVVRAISERQGPDGAQLARRGGAELVRLMAPVLPDGAALTAVGPVTTAPGATVDGADHVPPGWDADCQPPDSGGIAVQLDSVGRFDRLAPVSSGELTRGADRQVVGIAPNLAPRLTPDGACDRSAAENWGDPDLPGGACAGYFPVAAAAGGSRFGSGVGQGILVGDGDLELAGTIRFYGVILARGRLVLRDRAHVVGTVFADSGASLLDQALVERSRCAVARALAGGARPFRRVDRGWFRWP